MTIQKLQSYQIRYKREEKSKDEVLLGNVAKKRNIFFSESYKKFFEKIQMMR